MVYSSRDTSTIDIVPFQLHVEGLNSQTQEATGLLDHSPVATSCSWVGFWLFLWRLLLAN